MKQHFCPAEQSMIAFEKECNWCGELESQKPVAHQKWCASLTQLLLSMPPQPAPCNCHPPQRTWVGLTTEETLDIFDLNNVYGSKWIEFARTVEAKLKEKNT
jgi:hypothetical protein